MLEFVTKLVVEDSDNSNLCAYYTFELPQRVLRHVQI